MTPEQELSSWKEANRALQERVSEQAEALLKSSFEIRNLKKEIKFYIKEKEKI